MARTDYHTGVTDAQWVRLEPLLRRSGWMRRPTRLDLLQHINTLFSWSEQAAFVTPGG
jgi:hypothetical protein